MAVRRVLEVEMIARQVMRKAMEDYDLRGPACGVFVIHMVGIYAEALQKAFPEKLDEFIPIPEQLTKDLKGWNP